MPSNSQTSVKLMQRLNALSLYTYTGLVTPHRQELIAERLIHLSAEGKWKKNMISVCIKIAKPYGKATHQRGTSVII